MRYWIGGVLAVFLALLQAASIEQFKIIGVAPNLMLVLLVAWLVVRGLDDVLPMLFVAGVTLGLVGSQTPGLVLLALLPIAAFGVVRELHVVHSDAVLVLGLVLASTVAYELILLLSVMATGGVLDVRTAFVHAVVPAALVNVVLALPVYAVMRLAKPVDTRRRLSY
jgi:cell shape-determining protein MreD